MLFQRMAHQLNHWQLFLGSMNLCISGWHLLLDVCISPGAQFHQDLLLFLPGKVSLIHNLSINIENSVVSLAQFEINLPVTLDDQRSFAATCCRFTLKNRIHLFLTQKVAGSGPGFCHLAPRLLQAAQLVLKLAKFSHTAQLLCTHWLESNSRHCTCLLSSKWLKPIAHPWHGQTKRLATSLRRRGPSPSTKSKLFAVLALQWWNELPTNIRQAQPRHISRHKLKTYLFSMHLGQWIPKTGPILNTLVFEEVIICLSNDMIGKKKW